MSPLPTDLYHLTMLQAYLADDLAALRALARDAGAAALS